MIVVGAGETSNSVFVGAEEEMSIESGGTANWTTLENYDSWDGGALYVSSGGEANSTTINGGGNMMIYSGGVANETTVTESGTLYIAEGGVASDTDLTDGHMYIDGGKANNVTVGSGFLSISGGGSALNVDWTPCVGGIALYGGEITFVRQYSGVYYGSDNTLLSHTTSMSGKSVDNAAMCVMSGGVASNTSVVNIGCMDIFSGGVATSTTAADGGCLQVYSGGKANTAILKDGAELTVHAGGVANNITIKDDSSCVCVEEGGKITGVITVSCFNLYTYIAEGAIIDFNISNVAPGEAARVNNLAWLMGWEEEYFDGDYDDDVTCYTVTVSASQESGTYTLAAGAKCFGTTVTVYASTKELGTLSVGKSLTSGDNKYTLKKSGDKLQLAVVGATTAPTVKLSTTKPTNKSITITATFAGNAATKQYSTDNKTWKTYSKAITVSKNGTYYFRSLDKNKKASAVATCKVTNIDTVAPNAPTLKLNTAKAARSVTITATFSKDSSKKQYSTDKKTWKTYGDGLSVTKNGTYYFRGIDAAGNVSTVKSIKVSNIDRVAPAAPTVKASTTSKTKKPVTLTATFSKDSAKKQYSVDNKTWKTYSKAISVSSNGTYYFRGIDAAGNVSNVKSYKVSNITKPTLTVSVKVSNTKFTSGSVTVTATFSSDCTKKQYSLDCGYSWKNYTKPLTLKSCELIEFRGINAAGKKTKVQEVLIDNIMDTGNNKWSNATAAPDYIMTAVNSSYDKVDYYDLGDVENLVIYMERGKIKASFYDGDKNAIKCSTYNAKAEETIASSFTITANEDPDKNSRSFFGISPDVKYLKIEAAASGTNSYYIRNLNYIA